MREGNEGQMGRRLREEELMSTNRRRDRRAERKLLRRINRRRGHQEAWRNEGV